MNIDRYGQAEILTPEEIQLLFSEGLVTPRDRAGREMNLLRMQVRREGEGGENQMRAYIRIRKFNDIRAQLKHRLNSRYTAMLLLLVNCSFFSFLSE